MNKKSKIDPRALVDKLAAEERRMSEATFLAPIAGDGRVRVRISGIAYEMNVADRFQGWALLRMTEPGKAKVIEEAPPALVSKYLSLFPRVRFVLLRTFDKTWWAMQSSTSDSRIQLSGPVPVHLVTSGTSFDTVYCRFDGSTFWFEAVDRRRDPQIARTLSRALTDGTEPDQLRCAGAVPQEKLAYRMLWLADHDSDPKELTDAERFAKSLAHGGAQLDAFQYRPDGSANVRFTLDGSSHSVSVRVTDMSVLSAGVCLSGRDQDFDLTSLVDVLRESDRMYRLD